MCSICWIWRHPGAQRRPWRGYAPGHCGRSLRLQPRSAGAKFIDLFVVGDGETVTGQLIDLYSGLPEPGGFSAQGLRPVGGLCPLSTMSPTTPTARSRPSSPMPEAPEMVVKAMEADLDHLPSAEHPVVPFVEAVHDRIMLKSSLQRGCRFCQAGMIYRPVRERRMETLLDMSQEMIRSTGYEEMRAFPRPSTGTILPQPPGQAADGGVRAPQGGAVPAQPAGDSEVAQTMEQIQRVRKTGPTFAPEAGTQRLRDDQQGRHRAGPDSQQSPRPPRRAGTGSSSTL